MNMQAIRILFLKDLFLSRRELFAYFAAGLACSAMACIPNETLAFVGFVLILTVAIASGIHLIGSLLLAESGDQTKQFVMSLPVSLLDYSIGKIAVVLTTYLIPWSAMLACSTIFTFILPWAKLGTVVILPVIFLFVLCGFTIQLVTAVVSESVGWTICVLVGCNVALNVFLMRLFSHADVSAASKSDAITWPSVLTPVLAVEVTVFLVAMASALFIQTRKRDLV